MADERSPDMNDSKSKSSSSSSSSSSCSPSSSSSSSNKAAWLMGPCNIKIQELPIPKELGPHDVRIQVKFTGICGSDVHYYKHMRCAGYEVKEPMVLGHESAGVVLEVGSAVQRCTPGDRVALEPGRGCGCCSYCKGGRYNLCPDMRFFATPPVHGSLANQVVHPEDLCFVLPSEVSLEEGALCEPLSVAVHACRRAGQLGCADVAVIGAGPIGLLTLMVAKAMGASSVAVCDISSVRLDFAMALGADACIDLGPASQEGKGRESLGRKVDVVFDCVGRGVTMETALQLVKPGGKVLLVGMAEDTMTLPLTEAAAREVDILGVFRYCNDYPCALDLLRRKCINASALVTHRFHFSEESVNEAYKTSEAGGKAVKVMITL